MQLHYATYGRYGYPLIILHGLFGSLENWQTLSRAFASCYRVYALDARNHGASPHSPEMNYNLMADDLEEFMAAQGISSAYLLGHSMGGKAAMQFAFKHPEKVDKLVIVDIAPHAYPPQHTTIFRALFSVNPWQFTRRKDIDTALAQKLPDVALRQFLEKNLTRDASGTFKWKLDLDSIYRNYDALGQGLDGPRRFEKPALFIRGERSGYITKQDTEQIRLLFPYSRIVTLPGVGHWVHVEARRRFARVVLTFLGI